MGEVEAAITSSIMTFIGEGSCHHCVCHPDFAAFESMGHLSLGVYEMELPKEVDTLKFSCVRTSIFTFQTSRVQLYNTLCIFGYRDFTSQNLS